MRVCIEEVNFIQKIIRVADMIPVSASDDQTSGNLRQVTALNFQS